MSAMRHQRERGTGLGGMSDDWYPSGMDLVVEWPTTSGSRLILGEDDYGDLCVPVLLRRGSPQWRGRPKRWNPLHRFYAWNSRRLHSVAMVEAAA